MDKNQLIKKLKSDSAILAAILFGSEASGHAGTESDIDLALFFNEKKIPNVLEILQLKEQLSDLMQRDVDIVLLNHASPIIAMQAIKNGIPLFILNQKAYDKYEIKLITDYADLKVIRLPFEKNILKRKLHG